MSYAGRYNRETTRALASAATYKEPDADSEPESGVADRRFPIVRSSNRKRRQTGRKRPVSAGTIRLLGASRSG